MEEKKRREEQELPYSEVRVSAAAFRGAFDITDIGKH